MAPMQRPPGTAATRREQTRQPLASAIITIPSPQVDHSFREKGGADAGHDAWPSVGSKRLVARSGFSVTCFAIAVGT
jgi:hypothetical protein